MKLSFFNTLPGKIEEYAPVSDQTGFYSCGPTVYNYAHIGNLRTYIFNDILKRALLYNGFRVKHVMNITDIGHLTGDTDTGPDKMVESAKAQKKSVLELAEFYTDAFFKDLSSLDILPPDLKVRATDHIPEMIALVKKLEEKGFAYCSGGNVYFEVSKFPHYGELARLDLARLEGGARVEIDSQKKSPFDFVLWFTKSKFQDQELKWNSPWGTGYPGWHIECSAMSMKYLGEQFDIHTGGIDHIPVHHTNEIAQSEAATGKHPWVRYWLHGEFLVTDKQKMAKSSGNFFTLSSLLAMGFSASAFRYLCLTAHYRSQLAFSIDAMKSAEQSLKNLHSRITELKREKSCLSGGGDNYRREFLSMLNNDLNIPRCLAVLNNMLKDPDLGPADKLALVNDFDRVLGICITAENSEAVPPEITALAEQRFAARKNRNWELADELRSKITRSGYIMTDTKDGFRLDAVKT